MKTSPHNPSDPAARPGTYTYTVHLAGKIGAGDLEAVCGPAAQILPGEPGRLVFCVETDQSGLIGLLRLLHSRGIVIDAVRRSFPLPLPSSRGEGRKKEKKCHHPICQ